VSVEGSHGEAERDERVLNGTDREVFHGWKNAEEKVPPAPDTNG
jgi:hypothetical protein